VSELARRVIVAVVAIPLSLLLVYAGGLPLAVFLSVVSAGCAWELFRLARARGIDPLDPIGLPLAAGIPLLVHAHFVGAYTLPLSVAAVIFVGVLAAAIWARGVDGHPLGAVAITVFGVVYAGGLLSIGYALRNHPYTVGAGAGTALVGLPLALTWVSDIGAFAAGRMIGGRKLMPSVSPGKTVAGTVGGVLATMIASVIYVRFVLRPVAGLGLSPWGALLFGALISGAAQVGDLAESLLKREAGVKDSSRLIPGHGGLLDRLDSLLFVLPVSYVLLNWLLLPAPR
jgi:phosphatidate cytidylyltransferase